MPYPNEHAARIIDPSKFQEDSFRRKNITNGINIIIGKLKDDDAMTTQAYRFNVDEFTADEAKKWLKDHDIKYISFEKAAEKEDALKIEYKNFSFEIKAIDEEAEDSEEDNELYCGSFEGLASTFGNEDSYGDIIEQGAFTDIIAKIKACGKMPKALMQHSAYNDQGAIYTDIEETKKGLLVKGKFINTTRGRDLRIEVKTGAISDLSIGFLCGDYKIEDKGKRQIRRIINIKELPEISFVTFPANNKANILDAKSKPLDIREFEHRLKEIGFSNKEAKTIISAGYKALNHCDDDLNQREAELIAEMKEIQKILIKGV